MSSACTSATGCWDLRRGKLATHRWLFNIAMENDPFFRWFMFIYSSYYRNGDFHSYSKSPEGKYKKLKDLLLFIVKFLLRSFPAPLISCGTFEEEAWSPSSRCTSNDPFAARLNSRNIYVLRLPNRSQLHDRSGWLLTARECQWYHSSHGDMIQYNILQVWCPIFYTFSTHFLQTCLSFYTKISLPFLPVGLPRQIQLHLEQGPPEASTNTKRVWCEG